MTRIGTFAHSQLLLQDMMRNQERLSVSQRQVSTGYKARNYQELSRDIVSLTETKSIQSRIEQHILNNDRLELRLAGYDVSLQGLGDAASDLREIVMNAVALNSGIGLKGGIEALFDRVQGMLNAKSEGRYIYGGTNDGVKPVNITDIASLVAAPQPPTTIFDNNDIKASVQVSDSRRVEYGLLANEVGQDLMNAIQRIAMFESGTLPAGAGAFAPAGAFGPNLTDNQREFLRSELANLETVIQDLTVVRSENGLKQIDLDRTQVRHQGELIYLATFITNIEDVDMAKAINQLNQDQVAIETSYRVLSQLNRMSLLDYI